MVKNITLICKECGKENSFVADIEDYRGKVYLKKGERRSLIGCKFCPSKKFTVKNYYDKYKV